MSPASIALLASLGAFGGFAAGLLGFGGGVVMFPLLYYVPPLLGLERLDARSVAAVVVSQVFFAGIVGGLAHLRSGRVHGRVCLIAGVVSALGSFAGGVISKWSSERFLLLLFAVVTLVAGAMMLLPAPTQAQENLSVKEFKVPFGALAASALFAGVGIGFLGAGNFVFVPLLIYVLKMPTRIAIGSTLFIAIMNTATGFLGKLVTGQIPLWETVAVAFGAANGALVGEKIHGRLSPPNLRSIYAALVGIIAVRVLLTVFGFGG